MSEAKNLPAPALPRENFKPIKECKTLDELFSSSDFRERIVSSVPRYMTNDRMLSVVLRAHVTNPLLVKATPQSFAGACLTATNTGLEPNSALAEAHLIPFKTNIRGKNGQPDREIIQIQVIFGFAGLLKLAYNTGRILSVSANVVYPDADVFDWMEGSETYLRFKRGGRRDRREGDVPGYAFFHARLSDGGESMEVWPYGDVLRIRNLSQAYRRAKRAHDDAASQNRRPPLTWTEAPWVKHEEPMARKTMIRAGTKYLPKSVELANAVRVDEVQDRRDIDYSRVIDLAGNAEDPDYAGTAASLAEGAETEETQVEHLPNGATGRAPDAAFVDRRESQQTPKSETEQQQPKAPSFEAFLIDEAGEYSEQPLVDPVAWARAFISIWQRCAPAHRATLLENNEEALAEARGFPIADQLLSAMDEAKDLPAEGPVTLALNKTRDGRDDWKEYANRFRITLFGDRHALDVWLERQRERMTEAPLATRLLLLKACRERAEQLKTPLPEWVANLAGPTRDPDEKWADSFLAHLGTLTSTRDVEEYAGSSAVQQVMRRIRREKPDLWQRVDEGTAQRLTELESGDEGPPDDAA